MFSSENAAQYVSENHYLRLYCFKRQKASQEVQFKKENKNTTTTTKQQQAKTKKQKKTEQQTYIRKENKWIHRICKRSFWVVDAKSV